ncbi:CaiB/BaiF CoA transferase family protein [Nocardioides anomalus]|uniref:CaiB/BaiF CoA transferase family protein n=1 Tax=Nocardioides anomalus TaxID=2712223 RepID=UPI001E3428F5|nr:CaiB/BaiF CoA-transferase family protein [Nocardioides anomalus]
MSGPLEGVRVLELGSLIAGPFAGQLLADYGAEVVKVELPGSGDPMRRWGITVDGQSLWWPAIARGKKSVAVDVRTDEGRDVVRRIAAQCDVVLENFRPGTLARWGLGYDDLRALNPGIVVVHVSGFGQSGPRSGDAGFGSVGEAMGGIRHTTGDPDRRSSRAGVSLGDSLAAVFAVIGTLAALVERGRSGAGQEVDVAIYEAVAALMESTMVDFERAGVVRQRSGSVLPGVAPSNVYTSAEGTEVLIAANADAVFARLCQVMGRPELAADPRYVDHGSRGSNAAELDEQIEAWTRTVGTEELLRLLSEGGVPAGKIYTAPDMVSDPHYLARDMVLRPEVDGVRHGPMAGVVPKFSRTPGEVTRVGPALGEHTDEVLARLAQEER